MDHREVGGGQPLNALAEDRPVRRIQPSRAAKRDLAQNPPAEVNASMRDRDGNENQGVAAADQEEVPQEARNPDRQRLQDIVRDEILRNQQLHHGIRRLEQQENDLRRGMVRIPPVQHGLLTNIERIHHLLVELELDLYEINELLNHPRLADHPVIENGNRRRRIDLGENYAHPERRPRLDPGNGLRPADFVFPRELQGMAHIVRHAEHFGNVDRLPPPPLIQVNVVRVPNPTAAQDDARRNNYINNVIVPEALRLQVIARFLDEITRPGQQFDIIEFMKNEGLLPRAEIEENQRGAERVTHNEMIAMVFREKVFNANGRVPAHAALVHDAQRFWVELCHTLITIDINRRYALWILACEQVERNLGRQEEPMRPNWFPRGVAPNHARRAQAQAADEDRGRAPAQNREEDQARPTPAENGDEDQDGPEHRITASLLETFPR